MIFAVGLARKNQAGGNRSKKDLLKIEERDSVGQERTHCVIEKERRKA